MYTNKNIKNKKSFIYKILLLLGLFIITIIALEITGTTNIFSPNTPKSTSIGSETNNINLNPPTEQEKESGDIRKEEIVSNQNNDNPPPSDANLVIVDANQYNDEVEVRSFVSNIVEDGECTITFSKGAEIFEKVVPAIADASSTPCLSLVVALDEFNSSGTWNVEVSYKNSQETLTGKSETTLEIKK
jgi:hypothetical protein